MSGELTAPAGTLRALAVLLLYCIAVAVPVHNRGRAAVEVSGAGEAVLAPEPVGPNIWEMDGMNVTGDGHDSADLERRNWITETLFGRALPPVPPALVPSATACAVCPHARSDSSPARMGGRAQVQLPVLGRVELHRWHARVISQQTP